jgi:hypothetical protein
MFVSFPICLTCCWGWIAGGSRWRRGGSVVAKGVLMERGVLVVNNNNNNNKHYYKSHVKHQPNKSFVLKTTKILFFKANFQNI